MMTDAGSRSLEVRWIRRGPVPEAMFGWLGPFTDWIEQREDRYLADPAVAELGVKIKGGVELDLKAFRGSPGELEIPGGGVGRIEIWDKWRFPLEAVSLPSIDGSGWLAIRKIRRRRSFHLVDDHVLERPVSEAERPGCAVELTEFAVAGETQTWWTLALEATGDPAALERELRATADLLFRDALPDGLGLDLEDSMSYARWLAARTLPLQRF